VVDGVLLEGGYLFLECELERIVDGFGANSLIIGRIVAAQVAADSARVHEGGDQALVNNAPLMAYLHPGRFATIDQSLTFPFPAGMKK
jgi:flavin reductase (DIM6/NTAB) family NADH-FMN oxidoreductase RutF